MPSKRKRTTTIINNKLTLWTANEELVDVKKESNKKKLNTVEDWNIADKILEKIFNFIFGGDDI